MTKIEEIYTQLEQESIKLDQSIEIIPIFLGENYHEYITEYIEELEKSKAEQDADPRVQGSIYDYVQARRGEEGIPESEYLDLLIDYITEHRKIKNGEAGDPKAAGSLNEYLQQRLVEENPEYKDNVIVAEISGDYGVVRQYIDSDDSDRNFVDEYYEQDPLKLNEVDLSGCVFSDIRFYKSLNGAILRDCAFEEKVVFTACDLSNVDFRGSKLNCNFHNYLLADGKLPNENDRRLLESVKLDYANAERMQTLKLFRIEADDINPEPANKRTIDDYEPEIRFQRERDVKRRCKSERKDEINRFRKEKLSGQSYRDWATSIVRETDAQRQLNQEIAEGIEEIEARYEQEIERELFIIANEYIIPLETAKYDPTYLPKNPDQANAIKVRLEATQQDLEEYISSQPQGKKQQSFNEFLSLKNQERLQQIQDSNPGKNIIPVADFFFENRSYQTISGLNLSNLDLSGVNFAQVKFQNCTFENADLTGISFEGSVFKGENSFKNSTLTDANLISASGSNVNFSEAIMPRARMMYSRFTNSNFEGALLYSADLTGSSIERSSLKSAIADRSNLNKVNLRDVDARYVKMRKAHLKEAVLDGDFSHADFSQAQMEKVDASKARLEEAILEEANLSYANLRGAFLERISAKGANLSDADLESARLELAELSSAIMDRAHARFANFKEATLEGVHAHQADFSNAVMEGISGERLDISGAILNEVNLKNANLTEAVLENIEAYKADFRNATLQDVNAKFAEMIACDFSDAIARNMDISSAKLPMSHMKGTDLTGVKFDTDTMLLDVNFRDAIGADALKELQENQHLAKTQLFGRSEYGYCKNNDDRTNDRFKCQRIGAAILSSVIGGGAGYTLSGPFAGIAGSVAAGIISDQALHAVKNGYFREQGYISNQLGDKLAELGAVAIAAGAGSLDAGVNTIPVAATLCAATGVISPSSIGVTVGGALSTYAGIKILKSGFTEQSYTKKIVGGALTGMGAMATAVGLSSLASGFNTFAGTVLCGAAAGGIHGGVFAYKQLRNYDEEKKQE